MDTIHVKSLKTADSTLQILLNCCTEYIIQYNQDLSVFKKFDCFFFFYISPEWPTYILT